MAIDFSRPTKTDQYDTGVLQTIRSNQFSLACFLDDGSGTVLGSPAAGIKRYNASSTYFEKWTGSNYVEMPLGYLKLGGGTLTGPLVLQGNASAALNPVPLQQLNAALSGYASSAALAGYAPLSGAAFTGSITTSGNLSVGAALGVTGAATVGSMTVSSNSANGLTITGTSTNSIGLGIANGSRSFGIALAGSSGPFPNGTLGIYDGSSGGGGRGYVDTNGSLVWGATSSTQAGRMQVFGNGSSPTLTLSDTGNGNGTAIRLVGPGGTSPTKTIAANGGNLYFANDGGSVIATLTDGGAFSTTGLLYGRGGGMGIGQVTSQQGGSPSGGAFGDIFGIW